MKSLEIIKNQKRDGDYELIAKALGESDNTIKAKVHGNRKDIGNKVAQAFEILFKNRERSEKEVIEQIQEKLEIIHTQS